MDDCHQARYWGKQASAFCRKAPEDFHAVLCLASLVFTHPIGWRARRALRKAICGLLAQNSQVCFVQIIMAYNATPDSRAWDGLLHDKKIMQCFRSHLTPEQFAELQIRANIRN